MNQAVAASDPALTLIITGATTLPAVPYPNQISEITLATPEAPSAGILASTTQRTISRTPTPKNLATILAASTTQKTTPVFSVPFFSQLTDVTAPSWKKVACGITSLAMLIEFYHPHEIASVDALLAEGIAAGAYNDTVGWSYSGLISVAKKYGLGGRTHDYKDSSMDVAFAAFSADLEKGPIMASVHYTFKPTNPIPHLVIINGIKNGLVYYNDPAADAGDGSITIAQFKSGWKKRYIEFYPVS